MRLHKSGLFMAAGQFDDALEYQTKALENAPVFDPREGQTFIDDPLLQWSDEEDDDVHSASHEGDSEDVEWDDNRLSNVNDEDWEIAERGNFSFYRCCAMFYHTQISRSNTTV
jgi:hypothetical protein